MKHLVVVGLLAMLLSACNHQSGSGNIVSETRSTGNFKGIVVGGSFSVEIKNGPITEVKVESDDNIIHDIVTRVSGDKLKIRTNDGNSFNNAHFKVYITAPEINSLEVSGAADVKVIDALQSPRKIRFDLSGASEVFAAVDAPEVYAEVSGAASMLLSGRTRDYKAKVSGSGDLKSSDLQSENTDVHVSGAGSARVHASRNLEANASGAGNIYYRGGASVKQKASGAGNIRKDD